MSQQSSQKVIIVGAGISGLCAGVYAQKNGFDVEIIEMNHSSGGLATSWQREGYTFENCLHWLFGSNPKSSFYNLWQEVFDIEKVQFVEHDEFVHIENEDGQSLIANRDVDQLEQKMLQIAPEDFRAILRFTKGVRRLSGLELPMPGKGLVGNIVSLVKALPYLGEIRYWSKMTVEELGEKFNNPLLRRFFRGDHQMAKMSSLALVFSCAWMSERNAGYAIGGSQALIQLIEQNFTMLGGKIRFDSRVKRILTKNEKAVGVQLKDGTRLRSDWVISAADGHATLFELIPEKYRDAESERPYQHLDVFPSYLMVSLGIKRDLKEEPGLLTMILNDPLTLDPLTRLDQISFRIFNFDPTFAPAGKTAVTCFLPTFNYQYWVNLHRDDEAAYARKKQEIAAAVIDILERRISGIKEDVEVTDVCTPSSVISYTGNWQGSMEGFLLTPRTGFKTLPMTLARLKNFMMIGQWVMPGGGLPAGLMTARQCIRTICKLERRRFFTSKTSGERFYPETDKEESRFKKHG